MKSSRKSTAFSSTNLTRKSGKLQPKANAAGYEKRVAQRAQRGTSTTDIYEHLPEKNRRSHVTADLDREEALGYGNLDEASEEQRQNLRARLIGENDDDEEIGSEDDEELDSDAAFEESDEEKFTGFFSSKPKKAKQSLKKSGVRFAEVDLDEDEDEKMATITAQQSDDNEEEQEGDDDEFIDLLDVLDGKGGTSLESDGEGTSKSKGQDSSDIARSEEIEQEDGSSSESEVQEDEDEEMAFIPSDDDESPDALNQLNDFVSGLNTTSKKRKLDEVSSAVDRPQTERARKRRIIQEKTEAGEENEFRVQATGAKLDLEDLLAPLASQSSALQSLKKSTKVLNSTSSKNKALSAPLPQRVQERLDREAAYDQTKQEVNKWSETMKQIREAEHLSFPLQGQPKSRVSNRELVAKFKPTTELEKTVFEILRENQSNGNIDEDDDGESLLMQDLSIEEVMQRRGDLRKMRETMFRAEIKSRRVKKIKSKAYRRLRRKEKERLGEKINEDDENDSETEESRLKMEIARAKERATLKHKNTGKWARQMRGRENLDQDSRRDIEEMLARGQKLRQRIQGIKSDESEGEFDEDDDDGLDGEEGIAKIRQDAFNELTGLEGEEVDAEGGKKGNGVFEMKFMRDAMARRDAATHQEVDDFIKEMQGEMEERNSDEITEQEPSSGLVTARAGGRVVFRPGTMSTEKQKAGSFAPPPSDTSSVTLQSTDFLEPPPKVVKPTQKAKPALSSVIKESNPWLVRDDQTASKAAKKANTIVVGKDSKIIDKSKHKIKKKAQNQVDEREKTKDDAVVEISLDSVLTLPAKSGPPLSLKEMTKGVDSDGDSSDLDGEIEAQEKAMLMKGKGRPNGLKAFEQRDLVSLAFAGDNVVQSFEDAKRREIEADAPRQVDITIPGWGSWGGSGVKKAPLKTQRIKTIAGIDPKTRTDYGKSHIIISEKRDKKAAKYLVKDLPYPYTSKAQFERAMDHPLGVEWNTRQGFQRGTLPRVMKKPGIIIEPLEKLS